MTRINVIDPSLLTDQHLLAEHRETTRIPNTILSGKAKSDPISLQSIPEHYLLGKGHVSFFYNKLEWLCRRYDTIHHECIQRGFNVAYKWPMELVGVRPELFGDYVVRGVDVEINVERVLLRFPKSAKMFGLNINIDDYKEVLK